MFSAWLEVKMYWRLVGIIKYADRRYNIYWRRRYNELIRLR